MLFNPHTLKTLQKSKLRKITCRKVYFASQHWPSRCFREAQEQMEKQNLPLVCPEPLSASKVLIDPEGANSPFAAIKACKDWAGGK